MAGVEEGGQGLCCHFTVTVHEIRLDLSVTTSGTQSARDPTEAVAGMGVVPALCKGSFCPALEGLML